jgi:hypothetical protein
MFPADYAASHAEQTAGSSDVCLIDILDKLGYFVRAKSESLRWLIGSAQTSEGRPMTIAASASLNGEFPDLSDEFVSELVNSIDRVGYGVVSD